MATVTKEYNVSVCDVRGGEADGEWNGIEYLNGKVAAEYSCPIDLCKEHMELFASEFDDYKSERYDGILAEKQRELIKKMKEKSKI